MKKKILSVILTIGLITSIVGCGNKEKAEENANTDINVETESFETEAAENESVDMKGSNAPSTDNAETETSHNADDFEEQKDIFIVKHIDTGDGTEIDFTNQEIINGPFTLGESVDIYSFYFTYAGYTKPNIKIDDVWKVDEWIVVPFAQSSFLVKEEDFNRVATLKDKTTSAMEEAVNAESESATTKQNTTSQEKETDSEMASVPEPVLQEETPAPAPVTTYSEAEVISIFRSTLESNGIQWYPDSAEYAQWPEAGPSGGMGWGIEDISMTDPYGDAAGTVEGFKFGGWEYYYLESQGASNGYVHLKLYSG